MKPPHLLFALFFIACLTASPLPSFDYNSLDDSASFLLTSLLNHGGIVINNIPGFVEARNKMIESPLSFDASDVGSSLDFDETTGLTRLTISSMVSRGQKEEEEQQPLSSLSPLRNVVDDVVDEFLSTLSTVAPAKLAGVLYPNGAVAPLTELSRKGEGLEHYHYYTKPTDSFPHKPTVMELHRDAGCFIAMTVGGSSQQQQEEEDPFVLSIVTPKGEVVPASVPPHSLIILLGAGMSEYITTSLPFPALPHSLSVRSFETFVDRGWYGRMYFPPGNSVLDDGSLFQTSFKELSDDSSLASNGILGATNGCGEGEIFCWKQCMDATQLPCDPSSALCFDHGDDTVILFPESRDDMCPSGMANCELICPEELNGYDNTTHPTNDNSTGFCTGSGTSMFMDGFQFVLAGHSPCLNWFFIPATMDSWWKFFFGMCGQFILAVAVEGLGLVRRNVFKMSQDASPGQKSVYRGALFGLHMLQAFIGYLIMLGAMTYSVEVMISVLLGLGIGYLVFNSEFPPSKKAEPCCVENYNSVQ